MGNKISMASSRSLHHPNPAYLNGTGDDSSILYNWKIESFSSLRKGDFCSRVFEFGGYQWTLLLRLTKHKYEKTSYISLCLFLVSAQSYPKIKAEYNLLIYDQKHSKHILKRGMCSYITATPSFRFHDMIPFEELKDASLGLLVNDSCTFGVEILRVHTSKISECLTLFNEIATPVLYTWTIESGAEMKLPHGSSDAFDAGGLKWYIMIHPNSGNEKSYVSMFLELDFWSGFLVGSGIYVKLSLCMKDQIVGKNKKLTMHVAFGPRNRMHGWSQFLSYEDFINPSKGFLVGNRCIVEASIEITGSMSYNK